MSAGAVNGNIYHIDLKNTKTRKYLVLRGHEVDGGSAVNGLDTIKGEAKEDSARDSAGNSITPPMQENQN